MTRRLLVAASTLVVAASCYFLFSYSAGAQSQCQTQWNCSDCGFQACSAPDGAATQGSVGVNDSISYNCNHRFIDSLKCGRSKTCSQLPLAEVCPGHDADPPAPPPPDVWQCRWVTISVSGYNTCYGCWTSGLVFPCCDLDVES